ncbi:MAG: thioesterase family protein [Deinococcota bacterium]
MADTFCTDIQVRFSDTDAMGHVSNISIASYVEQARVDFFLVLGQATKTLILAHLATNFRKQLHVIDEVHVTTQVTKLGNTSVGLAQNVIANGDVAAETRSVVVIFDYIAQRPMPIPDALREALQAYLVAAEPS